MPIAASVTQEDEKIEMKQIINARSYGKKKLSTNDVQGTARYQWIDIDFLTIGESVQNLFDKNFSVSKKHVTKITKNLEVEGRGKKTAVFSPFITFTEMMEMKKKLIVTLSRMVYFCLPDDDNKPFPSQGSKKA